MKTAEEVAAEAFEAEWYRLDYVTEPDRHRRALTAGLDAFKEAHIATDDEREARVYSSPEAVAIAQRYLDRERRHSEVPEPQGEPSEYRDRIALAEFIDKALDGDAGYGVGAFLAGGILSFLSDRADLHAAFAQGEPSDAQVEAALIAHLGYDPAPAGFPFKDGEKEQMRAALRAATGAR